jgi:hypothetical protein
MVYILLSLFMVERDERKIMDCEMDGQWEESTWYILDTSPIFHHKHWREVEKPVS